jgi:hypothetical protein
MTIIRRDTGQSTAMQFDRWQAGQKAPKQNRVERVAGHPVVLAVIVYGGLLGIAITILKLAGALAPFGW